MHTFDDERTIQGYENYISAHGIDQNVIDAYIQAAEIMLVGKSDREFGLKVSARAKEIIEQYIYSTTGGTTWDLEKYAFANKTWYDKWISHCIR